MPKTLHLKEHTPLTQGRSRLVFQHPDEPDYIVKVMRKEVLEDRFGSGTKWYKKRRRYGHLVSYIREIQEYVAIYASLNHAVPFLQEVIGFAKTDMGLGLVLKAIRDTEGNLAPPLSQLIKNHQLDDSVKEALASCLDQILNCDVIVSDLNLGNLVYTHSKELGNHFVLIDGLGNNNPLPFKAISRRINHRSKLGRFKRLYNRIERAKTANNHP